MEADARVFERQIFHLQAVLKEGIEVVLGKRDFKGPFLAFFSGAGDVLDLTNDTLRFGAAFLLFGFGKLRKGGDIHAWRGFRAIPIITATNDGDQNKQRDEAFHASQLRKPGSLSGSGSAMFLSLNEKGSL
ncbi:MAG: hypothetical protein EOP04_27435 [Proteobacteria bacterium]|nr:MAG: hypothetical protein EOP04_27435 [Pseudomonadota bacterium]